MTSGYQQAVRRVDGCDDGPDKLIQLALGLVSNAGAVAEEVNKIDRNDAGMLAPERQSRLLEALGDVIWVAVALIDACGGDEEAVRRASLAKITRQMIERGRLTPEDAAAILQDLGVTS